MNEKALQVGVGRCDITPALGTFLMGYADPYGKRKAESVRDPLNATALAFACCEERAALVSLDTTIVEDEHVEAIRRSVEARTGIPASHVTVCAIQTHSAPRTQNVWGWGDIDRGYCENIMVPGAVEAVAMADAVMVRVRVGIGVTESDVAVNRRPIGPDHSIGLGQCQWGLIDPTMTVLRFEGPNGTIANLVHYGAHPTVMGSTSRVVSRDWPGIMIDRMEELTGARTLFINGAVGDIAPRTNSMGAVGDGEAALWEAGGRAAMDAMRAWRWIKDMRDVQLACLVETFELPYGPLPPLEDAQKQLAAAEPRREEPGRGMCEHRHWQAVVEAHRNPPKTGKPFQQVITALGPVAFVPFPGEPFAEIVLRLRERSPFQYTLCASTSCGNNCYLCTREAVIRGGYEPWVSRSIGAYLLAQNIDDVLVDMNANLLNQVHARMVPRLDRQTET